MFPARKGGELRREENDARHGRKRKLQADARDGKGVFEQNEQQRERDGRRRVVVAPQKRRDHAHRDHDARAQNARRQPRDKRIEKNKWDRHGAAEFSLPATHERADQRRQEAAVQTRDRHHMRKAHLG